MTRVQVRLAGERDMPAVYAPGAARPADRPCAGAGLPAVEPHAQVHARGFYERAGFAAFGQVYREAGIEHVGMRLLMTASR